MSSIKKAKRSAAYKACIELYKLKEINDELRPRKIEDVLKETRHLFSYMEEEEAGDETSIPGTYSKKRCHPRIVCCALYL